MIYNLQKRVKILGLISILVSVSSLSHTDQSLLSVLWLHAVEQFT